MTARPSHRPRSAPRTGRRSRSSAPATPPGRRSSSSTGPPPTTRRSASSVRASRTRSTLHAIDRRGRGASGDTSPYAIEREFEDVAAVAEARRRPARAAPVDVFGHSYGGRCALGAALRTAADPPGHLLRGRPDAARRELPPRRSGRRSCARSWPPATATALLATFMRRGRRDDARTTWTAYRADPVWPLRVAAAPTIVRELAAEAGSRPRRSRRSAAVRQPVLQILGGGEPARRSATATVALDARLADGRIVEIPGARHAAHHTHPDAVVAAVRDVPATDAA